MSVSHKAFTCLVLEMNVFKKAISEIFYSFESFRALFLCCFRLASSKGYEYLFAVFLYFFKKKYGFLIINVINKNLKNELKLTQFLYFCYGSEISDLFQLKYLTEEVVLNRIINLNTKAKENHDLMNRSFVLYDCRVR